MSAATPPGGDAPKETRLEAIRARVANSDRDELYAPAYGDRRYLLGLVDEMAKALKEIGAIVGSRGSLSESKLTAGDLMRIDDLVCDALEKADL